jgi:hypothetical protein
MFRRDSRFRPPNSKPHTRLNLELLEPRLAMAGLNTAGTVDIAAHINLHKVGDPNIDGAALVIAELTFLDAGDPAQQSVVGKQVFVGGTISGIIDIGDIDGSFETDEQPPTMTFSYTTPPLLDIHVVQTGTFEATICCSFVTGTIVATIDATANITAKTVSGSIQLDLTAFGFQDSYTVDFVDQALTISPEDFDLPDSTLGSVGDRVWFDDNGNGIFDSGESPATKIGVVLFDAVNGIAGDADDMSVGTTQSNADGFYSFINIPPGDYYLRFDPLLSGQQYATKDAGADEAVDSDVHPLSRQTDVLQFPVAMHRRAIDAGIHDLLARWQNPDDPFDVSGSGGHTPFDVGLLLRELKVNGNYRLDPQRDPPPAPFFDVNGDFRITPQDIALLLNKLKREGSGEGESASISASAQLFEQDSGWWLPAPDDSLIKRKQAPKERL